MRSIIESTALELFSAGAESGSPGERRLRAMVHADVAGYSRLIGMNDAATVRRLRTLRRALIDPAIRTFRGRIVNTAGDSMMIMFDSVDAAVQCALRVQQQVPVLDGDQPPERRIRFRVGINIGDVIAEGTDVHGDGSNIAARLQSICPIGGICVSRAVRDHVHLRLGLEFEALGPQALKNIARPVEAFALRVDPGAPAGASAGRRRQWKLALTGVLAMLLAASGGIAWWLRRDGPQPVAEALRGPVPPASASVPSDAGLSRAPRLSLVVLPFDNLDSSPEQNALADGITEDLTTGLAQGLGLVVTARNSAFTYKGRAADIKLIGNDLAVRYALEGSVRKVGTSLRVNAQLVSTETGAHLWADQVDADAGTGSPSHDEIIGRISTELYRQLIDIESVRGARERPGNPDATDLLLQAAALYNRMWSAQQQPVVMALYERAVQTDPSSVEAMAGLARTLLD
ncbi:MAG: adenylate cyclase, partial [Acetobacteraceae bacterium]|nr:adenylate cyclase [Acetobacteraceae bacterium]